VLTDTLTPAPAAQHSAQGQAVPLPSHLGTRLALITGCNLSLQILPPQPALEVAVQITPKFKLDNGCVASSSNRWEISSIYTFTSDPIL
jgi:hypothetical protein